MRMPSSDAPAKRRAGAVVLLAALLAVPLGIRAGHAAPEGVVRSEPADRSIVAQAPAELLLEFDGTAEEGQVDVRLFTNRGAEVATGEPRLDGAVVRVPVTGTMVDGIHQIVYSVGTRRTDGSGFATYEGTIRFTLRGGSCAGRLTNIGPFTSIAAPDFVSPPNVLSHAAVDKNLQTVIYATNGRELQRTVDGCSWDVLLDLAAIDANGTMSDALITDVVTAREVPGLAAVLVLDPTGEGAGVVRPSIWWTNPITGAIFEGGVGLDPIRLDPALPLGCGHPQSCHLAFSDAPPQGPVPDLYFLTEPAYELGVARLLRSQDLGATFSATGPPLTEGDPLTGPGLLTRASGLTTDVEQPGTVYVSTGRTVHVSVDHGSNFSEAYRLPSTEGQVLTQLAAGRNYDDAGIARRDVMAVLASDDPDGPAEAIVRLAATGTTLTRTRDLDVAPLRGARINSLARGVAAGQVLVMPAMDGLERPGIFEYELANDRLENIDTEQVSPWLNGQATSPICTRWFGHDTARMYLVDADDGHPHTHSAADFCTQPDPGSGTGIGVDIVKFPPTPDSLADGTAVLAGADQVMLMPGVPSTVGYVMSRAARELPVDIAFLFDTSGSMRDNADAVRAAFNQIADDLSARDIDANFGLAEFKDLTLRYRRLADIQPLGDAFSTALARMQVTSGDKEPHYTALHQLATGAGLENPSTGTGVVAGQQMNWRPEAIRIVIMASDEGVFDDTDGPNFAETVAALNAKQIHHVGMHIREELGDGNSSVAADDPTSPQVLLGQMRELSSATEAFARKPIDCDGDGTNDVQVGEPLVCTLPNTYSPSSPIQTSTALATAIVDLVDSIEQLQAFRLTTDTPAGFRATVESVGVVGDRSPSVLLDVTLPQQPRWAVTYACDPFVAGTSTTVPVGVVLEQVRIAKVGTTLVCGAPAVPPVPAATSAIGQAAVVLVPAGAAPPAPIPVNAPVPSAASANAFAQSAATSPAVGVATAPQMQQQAQQANIRDDDDADFQFAARRTADPGPAPALVLGLAMAFAAGAMLTRQRASQHAARRVTVGRRR